MDPGPMAPTRTDRPMIEALEQRCLLSAEVVAGGTLEILGTRQDDAVIVQEAGAFGQVRVFGVNGVSEGAVFQGVRRLRIRLRAGDDMARVDGIPLDTEGNQMPIVVFGGAGNDDLEIVSADGKLVGGAGNDTLFGGFGANKLVGNRGTDFLAGGAGDDILVGGFGRDRLFGESGDDLLRGGRANDLLRGGSGNDTLFGGKRDDDLFGGSGFDQVSGMSGADTFRGTFFEWEDFNAEDRFFDPLFETDPDAVTVPSSFWADMNGLDSSFNFNLPDDAWLIVSAIQHLHSQAHVELAALQTAVGQLSDSDRRALGAATKTEFSDFLAGFSDPMSINAGDLSGLFSNLSALMPGGVRPSFDALTGSIQGDAGLLQTVVRGVREMGTGAFPPEFEAFINQYVFGV